MSRRQLTEPLLCMLLDVRLVASYVVLKMSTKLHVASERYSGSGPNSDDFNTFSKGDSVQNYLHVMVQSHRRRFCPFACFGYILAISRRHRHVVGNLEVAQEATSHGRRAHQ